KPLLWQVTAFTLAHTITLALSIYGVISVSSLIIEPLIALSIAYVGIENMLTRELKPWRVVVVFLFGLLHGLGFAGVLTELGLPESQFVTALISFNIGVELGQLSVILLAFLALFWLRKNRDLYRKFVIIPGSFSIAMMGLYWTWVRII
ncbi:MAG: HupE/UreJ family protein, partial [Methylococcales bacterium]|nr:HupE/UreJ family protein [Methylococcales bacterium]